MTDGERQYLGIFWQEEKQIYPRNEREEKRIARVDIACKQGQCRDRVFYAEKQNEQNQR